LEAGVAGFAEVDFELPPVTFAEEVAVLVSAADLEATGFASLAEASCDAALESLAFDAAFDSEAGLESLVSLPLVWAALGSVDAAAAVSVDFDSTGLSDSAAFLYDSLR
jgi:hypothetical protein